MALAFSSRCQIFPTHGVPCCSFQPQVPHAQARMVASTNGTTAATRKMLTLERVEKPDTEGGSLMKQDGGAEKLANPV